MCAYFFILILKLQLRQIVTMHPENGSSKGSPSGGMVRMLGVAQTNEVKATQNLAIIVLFFMICWIPLYTINCVIAFARDIEINENFMFSCIILSHLNSAVNPFLYAYHLRDFRAALKNFFCNLFEHTTDRTNVIYNNRARYCYRNNSRDNTLANNSSIAPKISRLVKNSANVVAATAGDAHNKDIWNIPEDSVSSNDTLKNLHAMTRPATPYYTVKSINHGYLDTSSADSDNISIVHKRGTFNEFVGREKVYKTKCVSSPQLSKNLFTVHNYKNNKRPVVRSMSLLEKKYINGEYSNEREHFFSTSKVVQIFKERKTLSKSLSDEGHISSLSAKSNNSGTRNSLSS